jgi:hypothetical protein
VSSPTIRLIAKKHESGHFIEWRRNRGVTPLAYISSRPVHVVRRRRKTMKKQGTTRCKRLVLALAVLAAALVAATGGSALDRPEVVSVLVLPEGYTPLTPDFDAFKLKAGDSFGFVGGMYSWEGTKRGQRIGRIDGSCQIVSAVSAAGGGTLYCAATAFLPAGRILFQGNDQLGPVKSFPITGGTGRYGDARGRVTIKEIGTAELELVAPEDPTGRQRPQTPRDAMSFTSSLSRSTARRLRESPSGRSP